MRRNYYDNFNEEYERGYRDGKRDALKEGLHSFPKDSKEVDENKAIEAEGREILKKYKLERNGDVKVIVPVIDAAGQDHKAVLLISPFYLGYFEYSFYLDNFCFGIEKSYSSLKSNRHINKKLIPEFEKEYPELVKFIKKYDF